MTDLFISEQRWIYTKGATLSAALHRLADALPAADIPGDHYPIDYSMEKTTLIEVLYNEIADDEEDFYRAGICVSWRPAAE